MNEEGKDLQADFPAYPVFLQALGVGGEPALPHIFAAISVWKIINKNQAR